ncbi:hypothetical protein [Lysobacter enzymogenes]|uniref:hypothetical protein n=1 Tax=Lysobacter enzymogenes TaxID=69 RepID=UPI001115C408|nr:hypothetical protein [Lysobacter enzymogenes]UZW59366.1 peptidase M4 family protein [Lysobacter enzymogenes]
MASGAANRFARRLSGRAATPAGAPSGDGSGRKNPLARNGDTAIVGIGIGKAKLDAIRYRALTQYFVSSAGYPSARRHIAGGGRSVRRRLGRIPNRGPRLAGAQGRPIHRRIAPRSRHSRRPRASGPFAFARDLAAPARSHHYQTAICDAQRIGLRDCVTRTTGFSIEQARAAA